MAHNISVLISVHGLPSNHSDYTQSLNFALLLSALDHIMERYHPQTHFIGIEIMAPQFNAQPYPSNLVNYYLQAYHIIRSHSLSIYFIIHEKSHWWIGFWRQQLQEPIYYNVMMDLHLSLFYRNLRSENYSEFNYDVQTWQMRMRMEGVFKPIIVGAWSFVPSDGNSSLVPRAQKQRLVHEQILAMRYALGSYLWAWKIHKNHDISYDNSVQDQLSREDGLKYE